MPPLSPLPSVEPASANILPIEGRSNASSEDALRPAERWRRIVAVAEALSADRTAREELAGRLGYPPDAYDQFRRDIPLRPPPTAASPSGMIPALVIIDARSAAPFLIRATLRALQDQSHAEWTALVIAPTTVHEHPVGAFAATDPRIRFDTDVTDVSRAATHVVLIDAGTVLDPEALAWLGFALTRTGASVAFGDHDHGIADPGLRLVRADPVLFGAFDPVLLAQMGAPAVIAVTAALLAHLPDDGLTGPEARATIMLGSAKAGPVAGIPRILATRLALPLAARGGKVAEEDFVPGRLAIAPHEASPAVSPVPRDDRIAIVIPTRDGAALLDRAIATLRATARRPDRLDIVVVDNRSLHDETRSLFRRLAEEAAARTITLDTAFNWSLVSNVGAAASDAPFVAFVNNDIEMLSAGWDDALAGALHDPTVGAVGARLIYPGRTIQHAGIAFGFGPGGSEHEGRGVPASDPGPSGRFVSSHAAAAVTGAFLGVRRADFDRVGGFDAERLMIAHSDVDLCLKLRELGLTNRYCAAIEAIHHEGATRGINETCTAIAWDEGERADLIERWGDALFEDPGISPYWLRGDAPFELLREPTMREIIAHIDRTGRADPWRALRRERSHSATTTSTSPEYLNRR